MAVLLAALGLGIVAQCAVVWGLVRIAGAVRAREAELAGARALQLLSLLAPSVKATYDDPAAILSWHPIVVTARALFPVECAQLDRAAGSPFPFGPDRIQDAHTRWTADWLTWEQAHNGSFKLKVAEAQAELAAMGTDLARARLDAIEREKLDAYQARYGQYVRMSKALQALMSQK